MRADISPPPSESVPSVILWRRNCRTSVQMVRGHVCVRVCACTYPCIHVVYRYMQMYVCVRICVCACMYVYIYQYVCMDVCTSICTDDTMLDYNDLNYQTSPTCRSNTVNFVSHHLDNGIVGSNYWFFSVFSSMNGLRLIHFPNKI